MLIFKWFEIFFFFSTHMNDEVVPKNNGKTGIYHVDVEDENFVFLKFMNKKKMQLKLN